MTLTEFIGYAAGTLTAVAFAPQVLKAWRTRDTAALSVGTLVIYVIGIVGWFVYGLLSDSYPIILSNLVSLILAGSLLIAKLCFK
ncbi:MAG: SemiSWEET transporter [Holosporales bacterium]|jgi:MtN3 and saliva related transmembrane protein